MSDERRLCFCCQQQKKTVRRYLSDNFGTISAICAYCRSKSHEIRDTVLRVAIWYYGEKGGDIEPWFAKIIKQKRYCGERITPDEVEIALTG